MEFTRGMNKAQTGRSGRVFFLVLLCVVFAGILATFLLANDRRNLRLLQAYLGIEQSKTSTAAPVPQASKGNRLPPGRMTLPKYTFADMKAVEQHFVRRIQSDPKSLCERLKTGGFAGMEWTVSTVSKTEWECSSFVSLPAVTKEPDAPQSSVFIFIKGDGENRVASFRVKMNIENPTDRMKITELGGTAASIFLQQARWDKGNEIIDRIRNLQEFDLRDFGSRIQMKKEFGDTPRYNFLASQFFKSAARKPEELYFDRSRWLKLTDRNGVPMVDGMIAGEDSGGLPLPKSSSPVPR